MENESGEESMMIDQYIGYIIKPLVTTKIKDESDYVYYSYNYYDKKDDYLSFGFFENIHIPEDIGRIIRQLTREKL